jgi:triosephosphate isomerase
MNGSKTSVKELLEGIKTGAQSITNVDWIVFPPYPFLAQTENLLTNTNVAWGAQNLSDKASGAYTGEVSGAMLKDFGCQYVLVGHSERRALFGEDNELLAAKFVAALEVELTPIFCVGETLEQRENNLTQQVVTNQINAILNKGIEKAIIAYEPVWAIGTGVTATPEQAQEVHQDIRSQIGENIQILYGGSVKPDNAAALFAMPDIDGGLIGGASLKANDFLEIGRSCNK